MCGIATIAIGRRCRRRVPYALVRKLARELLVELQPRGIDASGIAVVNEGAESKVFKKPLRPDRLVVRPKFEEVLDLIGPQTNFIMLHSRATSVGSPLEHFNNHPTIVEPGVGIHNGTLWNEAELFTQFEESFDREGEVDSEIIFKLYRHYVDEGLTPKQAMSQTGERLWGAFTGALVDMRHPHRMVMFKNDRSLSVLRFPHYDMAVAVSLAQFYDRAAQRLRLKAKDTCESVSDGTGMLFDLNTDKRLTEEIIDFDIPVEKGYLRRHSGWFSSYCG
jgi:glucosamine 6-phosphate synthetase-like amidotransferase/phosphosugar isomerase protein